MALRGMLVRAYRAVVPPSVRARPLLQDLVFVALELPDLGSMRRFGRLERSARTGARRGAPVPVRVRSLHGATVWLRPGTSDVAVLRETFLGRYHLPPAEHVPEGPFSVLDLGANIGLTVAHVAASHPRARVLGVELDGGSAALATRNIAPWREAVCVEHAAVWTGDGEVAYTGEAGGEYGFRVSDAAVADARGTSPAITMRTLVRRLGAEPVDYVKMDIEGAEQRVLEDPHAAEWAQSVRVMKVEVHAPYSVACCRRRLEALGFATEADPAHPAGVVAVRRGP